MKIILPAVLLLATASSFAKNDDNQPFTPQAVQDVNVFITGSAESMTCPAFIFAAVVRIHALDQIGAGFDDLFR